MANFTPDEKVIKILANFNTINPSMLIESTKLAVINTAKSVIAYYKFPTPFTFEPFGFYDTSHALGIINAMSKPEIEVKDKYIDIMGSNNDKVRYYTTASDLVPKVPDLEPKTATLDWDIHFSIPADKIAVIKQMTSILKESKFIFFETEGKQIRITIGSELESSGNNYDILINDNIKVNKLDGPVKLPLVDFKILAGEYEVKLTKRMSRWENMNGVVYFIAVQV